MRFGTVVHTTLLLGITATKGMFVEAAKARENKALFRYVPITLYGKRHSLNTFALTDVASSCTLIEKKIALELGLDVWALATKSLW